MALPFYGSLPGNPFPRPNPQDNPEKGKQQICTLTATKATMASSIYVSMCVCGGCPWSCFCLSVSVTCACVGDTVIFLWVLGPDTLSGQQLSCRKGPCWFLLYFIALINMKCAHFFRSIRIRIRHSFVFPLFRLSPPFTAFPLECLQLVAPNWVLLYDNPLNLNHPTWWPQGIDACPLNRNIYTHTVFGSESIICSGINFN